MCVVGEARVETWSCTVGVRLMSCSMASACFSQCRGDSGCPCMAELIGMTNPGGMGGCFLWLVHQLMKALSGWM